MITSTYKHDNHSTLPWAVVYCVSGWWGYLCINVVTSLYNNKARLLAVCW